jgi:hypothetical protein
VSKTAERSPYSPPFHQTTISKGGSAPHEDGTAPATDASPHPPGSRTGSDALVEATILVVAKEEPSSKRGHGDACASAGPGDVWTATLARAPRQPLHERPRASL